MIRNFELASVSKYDVLPVLSFSHIVLRMVKALKLIGHLDQLN
jgi:hypothetical protein